MTENADFEQVQTAVDDFIKALWPIWEKWQQAFSKAMQPWVDWWENLPPEVKEMFQRQDRGIHYAYLMRLKHQRDTIPFIKRGCRL